jgi:hypothetical protein
MTDKSKLSNFLLLSLSKLKRCGQTPVYFLHENFILANPTIPDLALIRQWLLDEGSISKADLIKLVKETTKMLSNSIH